VRRVNKDVGEKAKQGGVRNRDVEGEMKKDRLMDGMRGVRVSHLLWLLMQS
jgi:hypothetical protein